MTFPRKNLTLGQGSIIKDINLKQIKVPVLLLMIVLDIQKILMTEKVTVLEKKYKIWQQRLQISQVQDHIRSAKI